MSNLTNTLLLEQANDLMEYFTGTLHERLMQRALDTNDLEALRHHVVEAAAQRAIEEDNGLVPMPEPAEGGLRDLVFDQRGFMRRELEEETDVN